VVVDNGRHYRHSFKAGIVEASKNSKSLSATPAMFRCTWAALFGEPPPFKCFVRSSVKLWRDVVAHYRTTAWVDSLRHDSFFLMADGSERKSKNILALYVVGFCSIEWEHVAVNSHYTYNVRVCVCVCVGVRLATPRQRDKMPRVCVCAWGCVCGRVGCRSWLLKRRCSSISSTWERGTMPQAIGRRWFGL
jgi:hypothetical protein